MSKKIGQLELGNAHQPLRLNITQKDIAKGKPLDPCECAASQCLKRLPGVSDSFVHRGVTYIVKGGKAMRYRTSAALRLETIVFDRGGRFVPGEYDLLPPPLSYIGKTASKRAKSASKRRPKRMVHVIEGVRATANGHNAKD